MKLIQWIGSLLLILMALMALVLSPLLGLVLLALSVFLVPPVMHRITTRLGFSMPRWGTVSLFAVSFVIVVLFLEGETERNNLRAQGIFEDGVIALERGDLDSAREAFEEAARLFADAPESFNTIRSQTELATSIADVERTLLEMSDEDFAQLLAGQYQSGRFQYEVLETAFVSLLQDNAGRRDELLAAEAARLAEERRAAEEARLAQERAERARREEAARLERERIVGELLRGERPGEYVYYDNDSCRPRAGRSSECIDRATWLALCELPNLGMTQRAFGSFTTADSVFRQLAGSNLDWSVRRITSGRGDCHITVSSSGLIRGTTTRSRHVGRVHTFLIRDDGSVSVHGAFYLRRLP